MPDVAELGRRVKAKHPGSYDDIADADLGRRVKAKFPGAYDDFTDAPQGKGYIAQAIDWATKPRSDEEKQSILDTAGEIIGGTVGSIAGGPTPLGLLGAGAGAVAGRNIAQLAGRNILGLKTPEKTAGQELVEQGKTLATNAAGEAVGRAIPVAYRAGKNAVGNMIRKPFQPTEAAQRITALADELGIPLNVAQRSGRPWVHAVESGLHRFPTSAGTMKDSYIKGYNAWVDQMNNLLDQVHKGQVTQEQFSKALQEATKAARSRFNAGVENQAAQAASMIYKEPVTAQAAGQALQDARRSNLNAVRGWADTAYGEFEKKYGQAPVRLDSLNSRMESLLDKYPSSDLRELLDGALSNVTKAARGSAPTLINPGFDFVKGVPGEAIQRPATITVGQARKVATSIKEMVRGLRPEERAAKKEALRELNLAIDASIKEALPEEGAKEYGRIQSTYAGKMRKLKPPQVITDAAQQSGNRAAGMLRKAKPEDIPGQLVSPTTYKEVVEATSPNTVRDIATKPGTSPMPKVKRWAADELIEKSRINQGTADARLSPEAMSRKAAELAAKGYPIKVDPLKPVYSPEMIADEGLLYSSPIAQEVGKNPAGVSLRLFPNEAGERAARTLGQLHRVAGMTNPELGEMAQRAYLDDVLRRGQSQSKVSEELYFNPRQIETTMNKTAAGTFDTMAGQVGDKFRQMVDLGKQVTRDEVFNTSGTAKAQEALSFMKDIGRAGAMGASALYGAYNPMDAMSILATGVVLPRYAAKGFTNPEVAKWLTQPPRKLISGPMGGDAAGLAGRAAANYWLGGR